jgi:SH3-like domain-containing protein
MNTKTLVIFLVTLVVLGSCSETNEVSLVSDVAGGIDSLKQIYAPDTRIALWNVSMKNENGKLSVTAEVENKKAQAALLKLKTKFPTVNIKVKLLPDASIKKSFALINNSVSSIRKKTTRASEMLNQALLGTPVKVLKKKNSWYLIQTPNQYIGWINKADIVPFDSTGLKEYEAGKKIVFNRHYGFSYSKPDINSQVVSDLVIGCILPVTGSKGNFFKVKYPDGRMAFVQKSEVIGLKTLFQKKPEQKELVKTALKFNGIPYLWGGFSAKAIDCSGFSSTIYFLNGIILQRDASQQTKYGKEITTNFDYTKLQPGDLLFFGRKAKGSSPEKVTHVAMYIGNGKFIHSSGKVRISCMDSSKPDYAAEYAPGFVRAVRIIGAENGNTIQKISENPLYRMLKSN